MFDLDDTIVEAGSHVSSRVLSALVAARERGYVLSVASGRPLCLVDERVLGTGAFDYCVCSNGASVVRLSDGAELAGDFISREDALDCHRMLAPFRPGWNAFVGDRAYFEWRGASYMLTGRTGAMARARRSGGPKSGVVERAVRLARRGLRFAWRLASGRSSRQVFSIGRALREAADGVQKMGCTIPNAGRCAEAARLLAADGRFEVIRMGGTELEITAAGVTKASGARRLMDVLGIGASDAVAFGDGGNDLPLARAVGRFVAMGNADDDVKAAATEVCPPVGEDGVAVWIEGNLLGSRA